MTNIKPVRQVDSSGCGIACLAMLVGKRYENAKKEIAVALGWSPEKTQGFYTDWNQLTTAALALGIELGPKRIGRVWTALPDLCVVAVNRKQRGSNHYWHWVVFHRSGDVATVLDPRSKRLKRTDFSRMRLDGYRAVLKTGS